MNHALSRACKRAGGQSKLARLLNTTQSTLWYWLARAKRGAPAEYVLRIEEVTGVPRHELRPDIFPLPQETPTPRAHPARSAQRTCTHEAEASGACACEAEDGSTEA